MTKYFSDGKTQVAINSKFFRKLDHVKNALNEEKPSKAQIEHEERIIDGFFILQNLKFRKLELYYKFSTKFFDVNELGALEVDTNTLYLALAEKELEDCIQHDMKVP